MKKVLKFGWYGVAAVAALSVTALIFNGHDRNVQSSVETKDDSIASATPVESMVPAPIYAGEENGVYYYAAELSEVEREAGKATTPLIGFIYRGEHNGQLLFTSERRESSFSCAIDCKIIKVTNNYNGMTERVQFTPGTVMAQAIIDAQHGFLKPSDPYLNVDVIAPTNEANVSEVAASS